MRSEIHVYVCVCVCYANYINLNTSSELLNYLFNYIAETMRVRP